MTVPVIAVTGTVALVQPWNWSLDTTVAATNPPPSSSGPTEATQAPSTNPPTTEEGGAETPITLPAGMAASGLTVTPVVNLIDGDTVGVTFDRPDEEATAEFVAQCDGEVVNRAYDGATKAELLT